MDNRKAESTNDYALDIRVTCMPEEGPIITNFKLLSLDEKLFDICSRANGTNSVITFDSYYTDCFLTFIDIRKFPYIIRNGEFEWLIPFEDVTVAEFLHTHNIQPNDGIDIESGLPMAGGPGLIDPMEVWERLWPIISQYAPHIVTTFGLLSSSITITSWVKKHLKKKRSAPYPHIFFDAIYKRSMWNHHELAGLLECSSDDAKSWLKALGYKWDNSKKLIS
jgi:hypothetical protein